MQTSNQRGFRHWVHELWLENCKERFEHGLDPFDNAEVYFKTYKYWLKREYKHQMKKEHTNV